MSTTQVQTTPIHVIGMGLDGMAGLPLSLHEQIAEATVLVGHERYLAGIEQSKAQRIWLDSFTEGMRHLRQICDSLRGSTAERAASNSGQTDDQVDQTDSQTKLLSERIVVIASGDPLFFGIGRLLLQHFPAEWITFHPHPSSIQLAFSRIKLPWQDAHIVSAHGRSLDVLVQTLQKGADKIAVLTDPTHTPRAIAKLVQSLQLPSRYRLWVCENLGGEAEQVQAFWPEELIALPDAASLNVVILHRQAQAVQPVDPAQLPLFGIPDPLFLSFPDRPGLMTKREIRLMILGELALQPQLTIWDIGAGTGSVSIEMARLSPSSRIYAVEKTAIGQSLIQQNCQRFQVENIAIASGHAPDALVTLPNPDRIFIGGSGGQLTKILDHCDAALSANGIIVLALATFEHFSTALNWFDQQTEIHWRTHHTQLQIARSVAVQSLTRWSPLNPVTLITAQKLPPN
ncbi:MAG: precorrin-6y C5,15-methyltransferase (decarboxylating) subunit CbiE [Thainema sp.]